MRGAAIAALAASVAPSARAHDAVLAARMFAGLSDRAYQCQVYAEIAAPRDQAAFTGLALRYGQDEAFAVREAMADPELPNDGFGGTRGIGGTGRGPQVYSKADLPSLSAIQRADTLIQRAEADLKPPADMAPSDHAAHRFAVATQRYDELGCEGLLK